MALPLGWREDVCERFPELRQQFDEYECDTPYLIWFELRYAFEKAYEQSPPDEALIRRIYEYAFWCAEDAPRGETAEDDLLTCVCVCFFEHIPQHPLARADMPRWFPFQDFMASEQIFRYHLTDAEFTALKEYMEQHQDLYVPRTKLIQKG
ncbi:hypothetical protein ACXR0O_23545 [Verrucomicrobiota bacterium sgz303538]